MTKWTTDPQERKLAGINATMADDKMRERGIAEKIASGAGFATLNDTAEMPKSDAQLAEHADVPGYEPMEILNPGDA